MSQKKKLLCCVVLCCGGTVSCERETLRGVGAILIGCSLVLMMSDEIGSNQHQHQHQHPQNRSIDGGGGTTVVLSTRMHVKMCSESRDRVITGRPRRAVRKLNARALRLSVQFTISSSSCSPFTVTVNQPLDIYSYLFSPASPEVSKKIGINQYGRVLQ
jgi:hypothetical protein